MTSLAFDLPTDEDPRLVTSMEEMRTKLQCLYLSSRSFDPALVDHAEQLVYDHRARFKTAHGFSFPPMAAFVLPSLQLILFYRTDLNDQEVRGKLVQLARDLAIRGVRVSAVEFAAAVVRCWPSYKPPIEELRQDPHRVEGLLV